MLYLCTAPAGAVFCCMYVKKLYRHHKVWFVLVMAFAAAQLFINYKRGMLFSPFYHYGMFSGVALPRETYEVVEIKVNGRQLQAQLFSANEWDNLVQPVLLYRDQQNWNSNLYHTQIKRLIGVNDSTLYVNNLSQSAFNNWYRQHVARLLHLDDRAIDVRYQFAIYRRHNNHLIRP